MEIELERMKVVVYPDGRLDTDNAAKFLGLSPKNLGHHAFDRDRAQIHKARAGVLFLGGFARMDC
jgi:hypothetical protein